MVNSCHAQEVHGDGRKQAAVEDAGIRFDRALHATSEQGKPSERHSRQGHQDRTEQVGRGGAGQEDIDEAEERHAQPCQLRGIEALTFPEGDAEHAELRGADQDQGARTRVHPFVCEGEEYEISEQRRDRERLGLGQPGETAPLQVHHEAKHQACRKHAQRGEGSSDRFPPAPTPAGREWNWRRSTALTPQSARSSASLSGPAPTLAS